MGHLGQDFADGQNALTAHAREEYIVFHAASSTRACRLQVSMHIPQP